MEGTSPPQNLQKYPCAIFIGTDGVLLEVHNQKEGCCAWSLMATASQILALSLLLLSDLMNISIPCLFQITASLPK
jgi:hypothetical protein